MSNEIANFYKTYRGSCPFIEGDTYRCDCEVSRIRNWERMKSYAAKANVSVYDANDRNYLYYCHCCGQNLDFANAKGQMYCTFECEMAIEDGGYKCNFHNCLMCKDVRTETPPFLDKIKKFYYLYGYGGESYSMSKYGVFYYRHIEDVAIHEHMTMQDAWSFILTARRPVKQPLEKLPELSEDDMADLETYADDYGVSLQKAYKAQHKCQYCFKDVAPQTYGPGHQFCSIWCDVCYDVKPENEYCDYCEGNDEYCPDCEGEVYYLKQKVLKKDLSNKDKISVVSMVLVFKELQIYNQVYDSLFDLSQYIH